MRTVLPSLSRSTDLPPCKGKACVAIQKRLMAGAEELKPCQLHWGPPGGAGDTLASRVLAPSLQFMKLATEWQ